MAVPIGFNSKEPIIPQKQDKLSIANERITYAMDYLLALSSSPRFSGTILLGTGGDKPSFIQQIFQPLGVPQRPIRENTPWNIQSVGKLFTIAAIFQLKEGGLDIDAPVRSILNDEDYALSNVDRNSGIHIREEDLPAFKASDITIRDLLTHRAGLDGGISIPRGMPPPGVRFDPEQIGIENYSNTGYALLAKVVECCSNSPFTTYVKEHVFQPSGIAEADSSRFLETKPHEEEIADGFNSHSPSGEIIREEASNLGAPYGNGCFWMLPEDLYKFAVAFQSGALFKDKETMLSVLHTNIESDGVVSYGHQGGAVNGSTDLTIIEIPDQPPIISLVFSNFSAGSDAGIDLKLAMVKHQAIEPLAFQMADIHFVDFMLQKDIDQRRMKLAEYRPPPIEYALPICEVFINKGREDLLQEYIGCLARNRDTIPLLHDFLNGLADQTLAVRIKASLP